jgi:hypothetical protein
MQQKKYSGIQAPQQMYQTVQQQKQTPQAKSRYMLASNDKATTPKATNQMGGFNRFNQQQQPMVNQFVGDPRAKRQSINGNNLSTSKIHRFNGAKAANT